MGSNGGTTLLENKCERIYNGRRKHHVVFHEWNQGKWSNTKIRVEEDADLVLKNIKLKFLGQPHDEELFRTDS